MCCVIVPVSSHGSTAVSATYVSGSSFSVSFSYFHDSLSPYGRWIDYEPYGYCWTPYDAPHGWRPYTDGYWAHTNLGWTWVSYEPHGWATYHYGRWVLDPYYGWVWVPDTVWAPSWVAWHEGPGWIGWAPLPPAAHWNVSIGLSFHDYDRIHRDSWCFVEDRHFTHSGLKSRIVSAARNDWMLDRTRNVTRYRNHDGWPVNDGVDYRVIEKRGGKVKHLNVVDASSPRKSGERIRGDAVEFYRPNIKEKNVRGLKPADRHIADRKSELRRSDERGGREVALQKERVSKERATIEKQNRGAERAQASERVNKRENAERANKRQAAERVESTKRSTQTRQFAQAGPNRRVVKESRETQRVEERSARRVEEKRGPARDERRVEKRQVSREERRADTRVEQRRAPDRKSARVEERSRPARTEKMSRGDRTERSGSQKAQSSNRGGKQKSR
jgi:hypothetical protein